MLQNQILEVPTSIFSQKTGKSSFHILLTKLLSHYTTSQFIFKE